MITLLIGKKGSGKTKKLIELANEAVKNSNGNVVVIEKGLKLTYDISHKARLVDSDAYSIEGLDALVGFISGICAANYDVTDIFVDSTLVGEELYKDLPNVYTIPATNIAEHQFRLFMANVVMMGYMAAVLKNVSLDSLKRVIAEQLPAKAYEQNVAALTAGYERGAD